MKKSKTTLTPKLRFPEFRDRPYHSARLGDVAEDATERNNRTLDADVVMGVFKNQGMLPMEKRLVAKDVSRYKIVEKDYFAYNPMRLNIGSIARWAGDEPVLVSPDYVVFRCLDDPDQNLDPNYLDQFRYSDQWDRFVSLAGDGSVRVRIYFSDLATLRLILPPLDEQQKIAECLSSLDGLIAAEDRKLEALKAHKKSLMQQLFPLPGQSHPRLRFQEFRDKGKWGESPLGKLLSRKPEYGVNAAAVPFSQDLPIYIRITDIDDEGQFTQDSSVSVDIGATEENYLVEGDIVLARTGASVGKSYRYRQKDGRLVFAGFLIRVRPNPKKLVPDYLSNYLATSQYWDWVRVNSARSGQPGINGSEYALMPVPLPPAGPKGNELAEQQRIADCLTALVAQINVQAEKMESLKQHKRGLMQQLFPAPEEQ